MQELASTIREQNGDLVRQLRRLAIAERQETAGAGEAQTVAEQLLSQLVRCLETRDGTALRHHLRRLLGAADGDPQRRNQVWRGLVAVERSLMSLPMSAEAAKFTWQLLADGRAMVSADWPGPEAAPTTVEETADILDAIPFGVVVIGHDKAVRRANRTALEMMGYASEDELLGETCHRTLCPAAVDRCPLIDLGQSLDRSERVLVTRTGERVPILKSAVPIVYAGQEAILETFIDISERRRTVQALEESEERYAALVENARDGAIILQDGSLRFANAAMAAMLGYPGPSELVGVPWSVLVAPDSAGTAVERARALDAGVEVPSVYRLRLSAQDQRVIEAELSANVIQHEGRPAEMAIVRDVDAIARHERERERLLERRAEQVRAAVEVSQELAAVPALDELFVRVVSLIKETFDYYHVQIFRHEPALDAVVLVCGYGDRGVRMLREGHSLPMRRGIVGTAAATGESVLAPDTSQAAGWLPNPHLPNTRGELAVPIKLRDRVLGIIDVQSDVVGALGEDDRLLLESLCGPIALAIEATTLREEMERTIQDLQALQRRAGEEGWAALLRIDREARAYRFDRLGVRATSEPVEDAPAAGQREDAVGVSPAPGRAQLRRVPITVRGQQIGTLGVREEPRHPLSAQDVELIEMVSEQVGAALEDARLVETTERALAEARTLYRFAELVSGEGDVAAICTTVCRALVQELPFAGAVALLLDEDLEELHEAARAGGASGFGASALALGGLAASALRERAPQILADPQRDDRLVGSPLPVTSLGPFAVFPVTSGREAIGALAVARPVGGASIGTLETRMLQAIATQMANAIQRARLLERTQSALDAADAITRRYVRETWDAFLGAYPSEAQQVVAGDGGAAAGSPGPQRGATQTHPEGEVVGRTDRGPERGSGETSLVVPLRARGQTIGVVELSRLAPAHGWSERERQLIESLVDEVGESIEGERQFAQTQMALAEIGRMYEASQRISAAQDREQILKVVLDVASAAGADMSMAYLFEPPVTDGRPAAQHLVAFWDRSGGAPPRPLGTRCAEGECPVLPLVSAAESVVVQNVRTDPRIGADSLPRMRELGWAAFAAIPITVGAEWLGYTVAIWRDIHSSSPGEMRVLEAVSDQAATALRSARLYREAQARARREQLIRQITTKMQGTPDLDTILNTAVEELGKALGVSRAFVRLSLGESAADSPSGSDATDKG